MATRSHGLSEEFHDYLMGETLRETDLQRQLRVETASLENAGWQIAPEQGQFLAFLVQALGARRILEVGTFTGYSSLAMALAMPDDGFLTCCDVSEEYTAMARRYWDQAGVGPRVHLRLGPAAETLTELLQEGRAGAFDFVFIDADKDNYPIYFDLSLQLLRPGGVMGFDNAFMGGAIADSTNLSPGVEAVREVNRRAFGSPGLVSSLLPIADGLTLVLKNP